MTEWIGSPPLELSALRGKVVLVRWFMSTECPYCAASAPALNQLHADYARRGLVVIGMYHHKRPEPLTPEAVRGWARDFGFRFPVAIDRDWKTLNRWWLGGKQRAFTSVSFLIDRRGIIRHIHPGGRLVPGERDYARCAPRSTSCSSGVSRRRRPQHLPTSAGTARRRGAVSLVRRAQSKRTGAVVRATASVPRAQPDLPTTKGSCEACPCFVRARMPALEPSPTPARWRSSDEGYGAPPTRTRVNIGELLYQSG